LFRFSFQVKQLLNHECDLIYECKVCKSLFRSLLNFISHKRIYCCDMYSVVHTQSNEVSRWHSIDDLTFVQHDLACWTNKYKLSRIIGQIRISITRKF
jgi:hypothetical protein